MSDKEFIHQIFLQLVQEGGVNLSAHAKGATDSEGSPEAKDWSDIRRLAASRHKLMESLRPLIHRAADIAAAVDNVIDMREEVATRLANFRTSDLAELAAMLHVTGRPDDDAVAAVLDFNLKQLRGHSMVSSVKEFREWYSGLEMENRSLPEWTRTKTPEEITRISSAVIARLAKYEDLR